MEECRAETVALYREYLLFCVYQQYQHEPFSVVSNCDILTIFGVSLHSEGRLQ
jgi:hypothetical protein